MEVAHNPNGLFWRPEVGVDTRTRVELRLLAQDGTPLIVSHTGDRAIGEYPSAQECYYDMLAALLVTAYKSSRLPGGGLDL